MIKLIINKLICKRKGHITVENIDDEINLRYSAYCFRCGKFVGLAKAHNIIRNHFINKDKKMLKEFINNEYGVEIVIK